MEWMYKFEVEDNEEIEAELQIENTTDGIIFLIDCGSILFENKVSCGDDETSISWFEAIIKSCLSVIKNKAMTTHKDNVALVFYRVKTESNVIMKNVFIFQDLEQPGIEDIQRMMQLQEISLTKFDKDYGLSDNCSLYHAVWCCQTMFAKCKIKLGTKQILLFTFDDDPSFNNVDIKKSLIVKLKDLKQNDINLEIIPVGNPESFNIDKFYKMMLISDNGDTICDCLTINNPVNKLDQLMTRTRHKQYRKKTTARVPWFLGNDNLSITVGVYNLVRKSPPLSHVILDRKSNLEVVKTRTQLIKESDQLLLPFDMKYGLKIDGKYISFEKEEMNKLRSIIEPGIRLLGFKPLKYLKSYYQIRPSQFIYPDESSVEGSTNLFSALLKRCSERNLLALCVYIPRKSSQLQIVALVPQMANPNNSTAQMRPSGFSVIFLPFEDDIRKLDLPLNDSVQEQDREMSEQLIRSCSVEYDPETILNPNLQKQLAHIEAIALDLEIPDKTEDNTVVDNDEINEHCGFILQQYKEHFQLGFQDSAPKTNKPKFDVDLEEFYRLKKLESLTIPQLKDEAQNRRIKIKGTKKADIIKSICTHFESNK